MRKLAQRRRDHRDLGRMHRDGVEDADSEVDAVGLPRRRGDQHGRRLQEEIVRHPDLLEAAVFGKSREAGEAFGRQVVVEAEAEFHVRPAASVCP